VPVFANMKYFFVAESPLSKKKSGDADAGVVSIPLSNGGKAKYLES